MHRHTLRMVLAGTLAAAAMLASSVGRATVMPHAGLEALVQTSDFIFRGKVSGTSVAIDESGMPWTTFSFSEVAAIAGGTDGRDFSLRCAGGTEADGTVTGFEGTPEFQIGDDAIVFFHEASAFCQVRGWEQGALYVVRSRSGEEAVVNAAGVAVAGVDERGWILGTRPDWLPEVSAAAARFAGYASHIVDAVEEKSSAQPMRPETVVERLRGFAASRGKKFLHVPARRNSTGKLPAIHVGVPPVAGGRP